ncbi:MAG: two-component system, NtrC family, nitrogen regulation sensor histidine kinase NtrY [Acidobacteriota bacterium]|nr:two-component system, NtrC family, nitrogen regulation sensor histidine kinase NtrY [Acidobacteriota bacterium]
MSEETRQTARDVTGDRAKDEPRDDTKDESRGVLSNDANVESIRAKPARRRAAPWFFGSLVLLLLATLIALQVSGVWEFVTPDTATDALLLYALSTLNFAAFVVFSFIFVRSLLKLRAERKARALGSKIKTRLVVYFIAVSLLPITAMAVFSYLFFNRTLEKTFGRVPADVVTEAQLARDEDAAQQAQTLQETARVAVLALDAQLARGDSPDLQSLLQAGNFDALSFDTDAAPPLLSFREGDAESERNKRLTDAMKSAASSLRDNQQARQSVVAPEAIIATAVALGDGRNLVAARTLQADSRLARIVSGAETFEHLRKRQRKVRLLGLSTLGLLTLMLVFAATWAAIHIARGIGTPIRTLAEAAEEVARGNLAHRVSVMGDDEFAVLADTFNQMTAQLEENRSHIEANADVLRETNLALEERRGYIETVLESLSTGVVSLDAENRLTTINAAALQMLQLSHAPAAGTPLAKIVNAEDRAVLERVLARARRAGRAAWQMELSRAVAARAKSNESGVAGVAQENSNDEGDGGTTPVALAATALGASGDSERGVVLVIEDLTELLAAQRAAAWSEVARRMAHEIKNPLTPIQLSAERIARNFPRPAARADGEILDIGGNGHDAQDRVARIVDECTQTITREVAGLKAMVDEFSRFARLPRARLEAADLNEVVRQAIALYEDRLDDVRLDVLLAHTLPSAMIDAEQLRRVFVNLIDNALEAIAHSEGERRITVATAHDPARGVLLAEVADTGHGIAREDFARLFQPYFSTRGRGTGLGLAIVRHIINDHGGRIRAEPNRPRGAKFMVELPVAEESRSDSSQQSAVSVQPNTKVVELPNTKS